MLELDIEKKLGTFTLRAAFRSGEGVTGLLGASGSGKSLTLKCVAGLETPDRGRIVLDGTVLFDSERRINLPPQKRHVGYLFQRYALFPRMTVAENILCGLGALRDKGEREARLEEALRLFRLEDLARRRPAALSGGQAQRAALARIWASRPRLLLLDEPFSALDAHLRLQLQLELKDLLSRWEGGVLLVTHSRDEAYHLCSAIAVVDGGRLDPPRETKALFADPGSFAAARVTGCKNIAAAVKSGEREVTVPEWNLRFTTACPVGDGLRGVAFRAHYLNPRTAANRFPVAFAGEMEEPFETILLYRYAGQDPESPPLWWRLPKDRRPQSFPEELGLAPVNILLLYS